MSFIEESEPLEIMKSLLEDNWVEYRETPKPIVLVANSSDEPYARFDMNEGDHIILRMGAPEIVRYRGNITYHDRIYSMGLSIWTKESRERLRNLYKVIRSICFIKKHIFSEWQLIRLASYQEMINSELNIWRGEITLTLENHAVLSETLV